jgi:hypothetical protein
MCVCIRLSKFGASLSDPFNVKEGGSKQGRSHTHTASERQASEGVGSEERRVCACVCVCERERECIDPGKEGGREGRWEGGNRWNPGQSLMFRVRIGFRV